MSALGSSVISMLLHTYPPKRLANIRTDKSGKKFAPKAPVRRPAAQPPSQVSARPSIERQAQSQTPQPQHAQQRIAASPTPPISLPTPASTLQHAEAALAVEARNDKSIPIHKPPSNPLVSQSFSHPPIVAQKQSLETQQASTHRPVASHGLKHSRALPDPERAQKTTAPTYGPENTTETPNLSNIAGNGLSISTISTQPGTASLPTSGGRDNDANAPTAKRRKVDKPQKGRAPVGQPPPYVNPNAPIPSTEIDEAAARTSISAEATATLTQNEKLPKLRKPADKRRQGPEGAAVLAATGEDQGSAANTKKPRKPYKKRVTKSADQVPLESSDNASQELPVTEGQPQPPAKTKQPRKSAPRKDQQRTEDAAAKVVEDAVQATTKDFKKSGRRTKRAPTPEGAELIRITPSEVKMADLCRDGGTGRKSVREQELEEMERAGCLRKKQKQLQDVMERAEPSPRAESGGARMDRLGRQAELREDVALHVPNTVIVNGQIQIDEGSLQIDRHAAAAVERDAEQLEGIDEGELSRKINSGSWLKRDKSGGWNEILLERFYEGLRMFGTDFEMISKMFPGKTRHAIKLKFCKEEKLDHARIKGVLLGETLPVDLERFQTITGTEYDDPSELERDIQEDRKRLEEEQAAEKQAMEDAVKERADQAAGERAAGEDSAKENRVKKKRKKGTKKGGSKTKAKKAMLGGMGEEEP